MPFKISFKLNLIVHILLLIAIMASVLIGVNFYLGKEVAFEQSEKDISQVTQAIARHEEAAISHNRGVLNTLAHFPNFKFNPPIDPKALHPVLHTLLENDLKAYAIYVADEEGDFYELINMHYDDSIKEAMKAPQESRWAEIIIRSEKPNVKLTRFYDDNENIVLERQQKTDYKAFKRPWFIDAKASEEVIRTAPYQFQHLQRTGYTYAKYMPSHKAVAAIDYTSERTEKLLEELKPTANSIIAILDYKLKMLEVSTKATEKITDHFLTLDENTPTLDKFTIDNTTYWAMDDLLDGSKEHHVLVIIPEEEILAPHLKQLTLSIWVVIGVTLLSLPFIWLLSLMITRPVNKLIDENNKIKNRKYDQVVRVPTVIKELDELSTSMLDMSTSIQSYQQAQADLLDAIIKLIADAIDAKSPYTSGHCHRVPILAMMLLDEADKDKHQFKDFAFDDEDERRAFEIGAWLHDCGKVTTPEYVVDKATKLETLYNRIHEIRTRFEVFWRDADIAYYQALLEGKDNTLAEQQREATQQQLQEDFAFIAKTNVGGEFLSKEAMQRVKEIGAQTWLRHFDATLGLSQEELKRLSNNEQNLPVKETLLADKPQHQIPREHFNYEDYEAHEFKEPVPELLYDQGELLNLCIAKGTLTDEERFKIKEHVIMTIKMLENVPFPKEYKNVPKYAGTHHETLIGNGYPRQLSADDLSIPEKIMAIADIFEALTASDRPYKEAKTLSQALKIMSFMVKDQHIDSELFKLFLTSGTYLHYAKTYLKAEQIDEVDINYFL